MLSLAIVLSTASQYASAAQMRHHRHGQKAAACKKQANAQKLHFYARSRFMHDCLRA
jgi:hypothetical protein